MSTHKIFALAAALVAWVAALTTGFAALQRYAATAGRASPPGARAAELLAQQRHPGRGLIVMAVHPLCPCTDASLAELGDLLARSRGMCDALILQYEPAQPPADWPERVANRQLGGVRVPVLLDGSGELASALGAQTSGHALFVDAAGVIRFHGGLTLARGHRGRSPAQDAILSLLAGQRPAVTTAPVFGCALAPECKPEAVP